MPERKLRRMPCFLGNFWHSARQACTSAILNSFDNIGDKDGDLLHQVVCAELGTSVEKHGDGVGSNIPVGLRIQVHALMKVEDLDSKGCVLLGEPLAQKTAGLNHSIAVMMLPAIEAS